MPPHLLFVPGAGGSPHFWRPAGDLLPANWRKTYLGWPGLGEQPHDPAVRELGDLVTLAARHLDGPAIVAAQSMGGIVAIRLALEQPEMVRGLVLSVTSGGIDLTKHGVADWRPEYVRTFPQAAPWITTIRADHTTQMHRITVPVLLLWGDADPISPIEVGHELQQLLPKSRLHVLPGGTHDLVWERASEIAPVLRTFCDSVDQN